MSLAPPKPSPLVPGYRLDRYELLCPIAEGGMASVWIARQIGAHGFHKFVAIKTILPKYATDPIFERMFLDEARLASRIDHHNVARTLDLGEENDILYLVMEYVDGDSLAKLRRVAEKTGEQIPTGVAARILADVARGLHAAHELRGDDDTLLGVVHRDVSPQNVLVSTGGDAKLIDFGIAKARDRSSGETSAGLLKGKVKYMAPEQALGKPVDRAADIWALGAVLYHLITGKPPYEGENELATLHKLTSNTRPEPLPAAVPKAISDVIMRAMSFAASERYATAADFANALEDAMESSDCAATPKDVAAYMDKHLGDRAAARKEAIEIALKAAGDRVRVAELMRVSGTDSARRMAVPPQSESSVTHTNTALGSASSLNVAGLPPKVSIGIGITMAALLVGGLVLGAAGLAAMHAREQAQSNAVRAPDPTPAPAAAPPTEASSTAALAVPAAPATGNVDAVKPAPTAAASSTSTKAALAAQKRPTGKPAAATPPATAKTAAATRPKETDDGF